MNNNRKSYIYIILSILIVVAFTLGGCFNPERLYYDKDDTDGVSSTPSGTLPENTPTQTIADVVQTLADKKITLNTVENNTLKTISEVVSSVADSIVKLTASSKSGTGVGSGVLFATDDTKYYIITNHHVIEGATSVVCKLTDGTEINASVVASDPNNDIGVLTVAKENVNTERYKTVTIPSDEYSLRVGDTAIAIGNPLGTLGGTVTSGIVSALDRQIDVEGVTMTLLQTDAAINQGNSGGGLFDAYGQLIGIVNAKMMATGIEGLGFAIPVKTAMSTACELITNGYVSGRPLIGITALELNSRDKMLDFLLGIEEDEVLQKWKSYFKGTGNALGLYVYDVTNTASGLQVGDYIIKANGVSVTTQEALSNQLSKFKAGDDMTMEVKREGTTISLVVKLLEKTTIS